MALDAIIVGKTSGQGAEVDTNGNSVVTLPQTPAQAGFALLAGRQSNASDPAGLIQERVRVSTQGRLTVGSPVLYLQEIFVGAAALNSAIFTAPVTTMTVTVAGGLLNLNPAGSVAANAVARVQSYAFFPFVADFATYLVWNMTLQQVATANNTVEAGFGICTGVTAPTDGAFFRYDATGTLKAVLNTAGVEQNVTIASQPSSGDAHKYQVVVENDRVLYRIDDITVAVIATPLNLGYPLNSSSQPFFVRNYNSAAVPTIAQVVKVGYVYVGAQDAIGLGKDNATIAAAQGRMASQGQTGHTMGTSALLSNNLAPGAGAAMTNTTAALGVGLGGQFAALPTLAVSTDGVVSSYQNPVPTASLPGKTLYIKGVRVQGVVTTILAGGPVIYEYTLAYGHTTVSLATAEASTTKAPRRVGIGLELYPATAAVGTIGSVNGQQVDFKAPIAVAPGEFVQVVAKNIGTVTTTGVIMFLITFDGYFE